MNRQLIPESPHRFLIGQLNSLGDCLLTTTIARQLKHDYPDSHLTWAIGSMCRAVLDGNPDVDEVWDVPLSSIEEVAQAWGGLVKGADEGLRTGRFSRVFLTQISPANLHHYDGSIRSSLFRAYPYAITVPVAPVLQLSTAEVIRARQFVTENKLTSYRHVILLECAPRSGQSPLNPESAWHVAESVTQKYPDVAIVLSSNQPIPTGNQQVLDGSVLSFRENAELARHCTLMVGGSSGITWLCTSEWVGGMPMIQLLDGNAQWSNSVLRDFETWNLPTDELVEIQGQDADQLTQCISTFIENGIGQARKVYQQDLSVNYRGVAVILTSLLKTLEFKKSWQLLRINLQRNDFKLLSFFNAWIHVVVAMGRSRLQR